MTVEYRDFCLSLSSNNSDDFCYGKGQRE